MGTGGVSLRDAINAANANGEDNTIVLSVAGVATLSGILPNITSNLVIEGPGAATLSISGNNASAIFFVDGATVVITGVTLANARAGGGTAAST